MVVWRWDVMFAVHEATSCMQEEDAGHCVRNLGQDAEAGRQTVDPEKHTTIEPVVEHYC